MWSACCRLSTERPRSPWWRIGRASAEAANPAGASAQAASSAPARRREEGINGGIVMVGGAYEVS
jgi:hypothetical protein